MENSIIDKVKEAQKRRGFKSNKEFYNAFNKAYQHDIDNGFVKSLDKDFIYRVFSGKMKHPQFNSRFAKICEFLKVNIAEFNTSSEISQAAFMVDELIRQKPELEKQIYSVIQSITNLSKGVRI